jgi:hypothetical protein
MIRADLTDAEMNCRKWNPDVAKRFPAGRESWQAALPMACDGIADHVR